MPILAQQVCVDSRWVAHRQPKLAVCVLEDFIDSLNIVNEQVEMKTQIKKLVNKTLLQTCQPPKHANLEMLKKSPEKPGDWDVKPGDFQNMC